MNTKDTRFSWTAVATASLGGLLFGFDTAVISGVTAALREAFTLSPAGLGLAVSAALWGTLLGALVAGRPGDRYGSRTVLRVIAVLYVVSGVGCALSWNLESLMVFRFIGGIAIGGSSVLAPVYIAEVSPAERRGLLVGLFQFNIVVGILLAYVSNFAVAQAVSGDLVWRAKLGVAVLPALLFLVMLYRVPHSPRWLLANGRRDEAAAAVTILRMGEAAAVLASFAPDARGSQDARLSWALHRKPILLALAIGTFNQLSGINAILYYINDIFAAAGFSTISADLQAVVIGIANLFATLGAMLVIDRLGRKPLLLIGAGGTAVTLAGVAAIYASESGEALLLPMLVGFIVSFAISQGAVIWVYLSEIFPTPVRARGQAIGSASHWVMNALVSLAFPIVAAQNQALPFWFFAAAMLVQIVVVWKFFPETKRVSLEAMGRAVNAP